MNRSLIAAFDLRRLSLRVRATFYLLSSRYLAQTVQRIYPVTLVEVRERAARQGRNPHTGETIEIAAAKVPAFKSGKALKDAIQ